MTTLLQVSDPHFGTEQPPVVSALRELALALKPDVLVLSGDITQRARPAEFSRARAFCDSLAIPQMIALPGNHDIPLFHVFERLFSPYRRYRAQFGTEAGNTLETPSLRLITVKTTRRWRHKNGEVSRAQIEATARFLASEKSRAAARLQVVVVHQPVYVPRAEDEHDRLRNWEPALRAWADAGADVVMGGHIHLPYSVDLSAEMTGLARRLWCVQAGTALSSRIRREAPNSVNVLRCEAGPACSLERWDYRASSGRFENVHSTGLTLGRHPGAAASPLG